MEENQNLNQQPPEQNQNPQENLQENKKEIFESKDFIKNHTQNQPTNSLKQQIKKFFTDVSVVVIGIMLSLWLNDLISNYNQQKEVKTFLLALKSDFEKDLVEIRDDMIGYNLQGKTFEYFASLRKNEIIPRDSARKYQEGLFNFVALLTNDGRYQGFKSAGKLGNITDTQLQDDIVNFYQEDLPVLLLSTHDYNVIKRKFVEFIDDNRVRLTDSTTNIKEVLNTEKAHFLARRLSSTQEILGRYMNCVKKMEKIITQIKKKYN